MAAASKTSEAEASTEEEKWKLAAALSYALLILFIGIPVWWKTTEVYRVALPYEEIRSLNESTLNISARVTVAVCESSFSDAEIATELEKGYLGLQNSDRFRVLVHWDTRQCSPKELEIIQRASSLTDLDAELQSWATNAQKVSGITVYVLPGRSDLMNESVTHVGIYRNMFLKAGKEFHVVVSQISSLLQSTIINPLGLQEVHTRFAGTKKERPDKTSMRTLPSTAAVDVTFTLMLPDPTLASVAWDIEAATRVYLTPFADKLREVVTLDFKSQVFYLTVLDIRAHYHSERKHYALTADQLPRIINPVESKLGSYVSTNPGLNFVIYVPPLHQTPLQIYDGKGEPSPLNAFLLPRWGGFMLYNADRGAATTVDMQRVMGTILPQLRSLLGIPHQMSSPTIGHSDMDYSHLRDWELDSILRVRTIENLLTSASTLQSLAQLLEEIGNIVIADHVGEKVYEAVENISRAYGALDAGNIMDAFSFSKKSLMASEAAFFDPSMLALLYFPDDQKYAIYVPLFLPVSLPLVMSLVSVFKYLRRNGRTDTKTEKVD